AILERIKYRTHSSEPVDAEEKAYHREQQAHLREFSERFHSFIEDRHVPLDDGRETGFPSDTGLNLLVDEKGENWFSSILDWFSRWPRSDWSVFPRTGHPHAIHFGAIKDAGEIKQLVRQAVAISEKGRALPALSLGRSLWYYGVESWLANS